MKRVVRTPSYRDDLAAIQSYIAKDSPRAAVDLWLEIDDQVEKLSDPNHPRRKGLLMPGAIEMVAHPNYVVILEEDDFTVTVLSVVHVKRKHP